MMFGETLGQVLQGDKLALYLGYIQNVNFVKFLIWAASCKKRIFWHVCSAKAKINLRIRAV